MLMMTTVDVLLRYENKRHVAVTSRRIREPRTATMMEMEGRVDGVKSLVFYCEILAKETNLCAINMSVSYKKTLECTERTKCEDEVT